MCTGIGDAYLVKEVWTGILKLLSSGLGKVALHEVDEAGLIGGMDTRVSNEDGAKVAEGICEKGAGGGIGGD